MLIANRKATMGLLLALFAASVSSSGDTLDDYRNPDTSAIQPAADAIVRIIAHAMDALGIKEAEVQEAIAKESLSQLAEDVLDQLRTVQIVDGMPSAPALGALKTQVETIERYATIEDLSFLAARLCLDVWFFSSDPTTDESTAILIERYLVCRYGRPPSPVPEATGGSVSSPPSTQGEGAHAEKADAG